MGTASNGPPATAASLAPAQPSVTVGRACLLYFTTRKSVELYPTQLKTCHLTGSANRTADWNSPLNPSFVRETIVETVKLVSSFTSFRVPKNVQCYPVGRARERASRAAPQRCRVPCDGYVAVLRGTRHRFRALHPSPPSLPVAYAIPVHA